MADASLDKTMSPNNRKQSHTDTPIDTHIYDALMTRLPHTSVVVYNTDLVFTHAAGMGLAEIGLTPADFIGRSLQDIVPPVFRDRDEPRLRRVLQGETLAFQSVYGGRLYQVILSPLIDAESQVIGGLAVARNISPGVDSDDPNPRHGQQLYQALFEQSNDAVFILDLEGNHVDANQRAADMLGYTPPEIITRSFRDIVVPTEISRSENVLGRLLAGESVRPYERLFRRKDGRIVQTEINAELVRDDDGTPLYIQSVVRDITDRKQQEQNALKLRLEQEHRRVLRHFVESAMHEFRTPLTIIYSSAFLMSSQAEAEKRQGYLERIERQIELLTQLLDMLLEMTRLDSETLIHPASHDLNEQTRRIVDAMRGTAQDRSHTLHLDLYEPNVDALIDAEYLEKALLHLLDNAVRFTPSGGEITVRTGIRDDHAVIDIIDNGPGIASEDLPNVFTAFWRQDVAHTTPGHGLGLTIAQRIIQVHNGTIEVSSTPGQGCHFTICLPRPDKPYGP